MHPITVTETERQNLTLHALPQPGRKPYRQEFCWRDREEEGGITVEGKVMTVSTNHTFW